MQPLDVVYPLGNGSKNKDDLELRFSLRSIADQPWLNNVYLVGHKPDWIQNVTHIPLQDFHPTTTKDKNIIFKVLRACHIPQITENFLIWSDDIYALRHLEPEDFGPYHEIPSQYDDITFLSDQQITSTWKKRLKQTVQYCQKHGYPDFTPDFHIPYLVSKILYPQIMLEIPWHLNNGLLTHVFMNVMVHQGQMPEPKTNPDAIVRIKEKLRYEAIEDITEHKLFLNHDNTGLTTEMYRFLTTKFPKASKYE